MYFKGIDYFSCNFDAQGGAVIYAGTVAQQRGDGWVFIPYNDPPALLESGL